MVGREGFARLVSRNILDQGLIANLVEYPAVAKGSARFRFQVMANHTSENIIQASQAFSNAYIAARAEWDDISGEMALGAI